ncbi:MAG: Na/Pi cotransporter family protein, partial [Caldilineaceae bacterium]|nr:Na/Pi cotransporter family protein [Caldilineaceae bacterium]
MEIFSAFVLGLGLFFVGMRLVGDSLRQLSSGRLRALIANSTQSGHRGRFTGLLLGLLMQSATAVTFLLVSTVSSGYISAVSALPVIIWSNVGLTALAFVATLRIQPIVAFVVGVAGMGVGMVRVPKIRNAAGVVLGIGLILFGLSTMSGGATALSDAGWFRSLFDATDGGALIAFFVGFVVAAILQSNTGASLLIITLAGAGLFRLPQAMMLIYGTNLGAIVLRAVLSANLSGRSLRLVRLEDLFCVWSGVLMVTLFYIEQWTEVPLVRAAVTAATPHLQTQLALAFLLSNLLPALTISPLLTQSWQFLSRFWPSTAAEHAAQLRYLSPSSMQDLSLAMDLLAREEARLLEQIQKLWTKAPAESKASDLQQAVQAFTVLAAAIESYAGKLATSQELAASDVARLFLLREELSSHRRLQECVLVLRETVDTLPQAPESWQVLPASF